MSLMKGKTEINSKTLKYYNKKNKNIKAK